MKNMRLLTMISLWVLLLGIFFPVIAIAEFKIVIMQDNKGDAVKYRPLLDYLKANGNDVAFVAARSYPHAAELFAKGDADGMFSGSGIAGCMIIKNVAYPVVRPVHKEGWSTYWAVVIGTRGTGRFTQEADYFIGKRVIFCSLASSGEFYFRSIIGTAMNSATTLKASSHGAALDALNRKAADIAIIKNRVWDKAKERYPDLMRLGEDPGENPDGTLIIAKHTETADVKKLVNVFLRIEGDPSSTAAAVKEKLGIKGYTRTTLEDFRFTLRLLKKAGVDENFTFIYK